MSHKPSGETLETLRSVLNSDPEFKQIVFNSGLLRWFRRYPIHRKPTINIGRKAAEHFLQTRLPSGMFRYKLNNVFYPSVIRRTMPPGFNAVVIEWFEMHWPEWQLEWDSMNEYR